MIVKDWLKQTALKFSDSGIHSAELDALILLEFVSHKDRTSLLTNLHLPVDELVTDIDALTTLVAQRFKNIPLAYLVGSKEFYNLQFIVNKHTLIPRPESEAIVEWAIRFAKHGTKTLDVGTGSGNLAIALKVNRPDLLITASDLEAEALKIASQNASKHKVKIELIQSDLLANIDNKFSLIIANLPYLKQSGTLKPELAYEPASALFAGEDGLDIYRRLTKQLKPHLLNDSALIIEHEPNQLKAIKALFSDDFAKIEKVSRFISVFKVS